MGHIFDPDVIHRVAKMGIGLPHREMCQVVMDELARLYPGHIETRQDWMFNMVAGATGVMTILHASLSEYVIIFGSPIGTEGFSGRYAVEIYDAVMAGEMWTYTDDAIAERVITKPGDMAHLARERVKGYRIEHQTWMLEYGRGLIPTALPLGVGDAIFSAMDFYTVWKTLSSYGRLTLKSLARGKI